MKEVTLSPRGENSRFLEIVTLLRNECKSFLSIYTKSPCESYLNLVRKYVCTILLVSSYLAWFRFVSFRFVSFRFVSFRKIELAFFKRNATFEHEHIVRSACALTVFISPIEYLVSLQETASNYVMRQRNCKLCDLVDQVFIKI